MTLEDQIRAIAREEVAAALAALPPVQDEWLGTTEAAELLGITPGTLSNIYKQFPSYKVGGKRRYRRCELERRVRVVALPDSDADGLAGVPLLLFRLAKTLSLPFL